MLQRRFFDSMEIGAYRLDADRQIIDVNEALLNFSGRIEEETTGKEASFLFENQKAEDAFFEELFAEGCVSGRRESLENGERRVTLEHFAGVVEDDPRVFEGICFDVTSEAASEEAHRLAVELLEIRRRQLVDAERLSLTGSWEWSVEDDAVWWSPGLCRIGGHEYRDDADRTFNDFVAAVHPEDRDRVISEIEGAMERRESYTIEHRILVDGDPKEIISRGEVRADEEGEILFVFGSVIDVSVLRKQAAMERRRDAEAAIIMSRLPALIWTTSEDLTIDYVSGQLALIDQSELCEGSPVSEVFDAPVVERAHLTALRSGHGSDFTWKTGEKWLSGHVEPLRGDREQVVGCIGLLLDVSETFEAEDRITYQAFHDVLTGLPNRQLLTDRLESAILLARRRDGDPAIIFFDLDRFKVVNDTMGHSAGDTLLIEVAKRLTGRLRSEDTVARIGGDEFVCLLPGSTSEHAHRVAEELLAEIAEPFSIDGRDLHVTTSAGVSVFPHDGATAEELLASADSALYRAKQDGRNTVRLCTPELTARIREHAEIEADLRTAIDQGQFVVYYQPIIELSTGDSLGLEALVRWEHPEKGLLLPDAFIPIAEESRLIHGLGRCVIEIVTEQLRSWSSAGLSQPFVNINGSPVQFVSQQFVDDLSEAVRGNGFRPVLNVEITENALMSPPAIEQLKRLEELGVGRLIDDFGTGYSSLAYLQKMPITGLKIDRSFVSRCPTDTHSVAIVRAIIATAKAMQLTVTAEGVETEDEARFLTEEGCDFAQGWYYGHPVPAADLELD